MSGRSRHLDDEIAGTLMKEMEEGSFAQAKTLPPEKDLAERFGVSRPVIRAGLGRLEREGFVTRKHGVGTVINHHVLGLKSRMDMEKEFLEVVRDAGCVPGVSDVSVRTETADEETARKLELPEGAAVLRIERTITADGEPAIACMDTLPLELFSGKPTLKDLKTLPVFAVLKKYGGPEVDHDLTEIRAVRADKQTAQKLMTEEGDAILCMDEVGYDLSEKPVIVSLQYYAGTKIRHTILRKKM